LGKLSTNALVGLEIDDAEVRLAVAAPNGAGYHVRAFCRALPAGAVESGYVVDEERVVEALRGLLTASGTRPRRAALVLSGRQTICRVEPLADPQDSTAISACEERMRRYVIFGGQPTTMGHLLQAGGEGPRGEGPTRLLSAAALRHTVLRQAAVARRCGLTVVRAEPSMAVLARAILGGKEPGKPRFLMTAGRSGCEIGVVRQDGLIFCQRLGTERQTLPANAGALTSTLELLEDYHLRHAGGREPIEELLWCGTAEGMETLFDRLAAAGVVTTWLDPGALPGVAQFECDGVDGPSQRSTLAPVVAEALAGAAEQAHLNLLPLPEKKSGHGFLAPWLVVPVLLTVLAAGGLAVWDKLVRDRAARFTEVVNHPTPQMVECARLQQLESALKQRQADAALLLSSVPRWLAPAFLDELACRLPEEVWLDRLEIKRTGQCVLEGMAQVEDAVYALADSLRLSPTVESVRMGGTGTDREAGLFLTRFRVEAALAKQASRADEPRQGREGRPHE